MSTWGKTFRRALRVGLSPEVAALHAAATHDDPVMHYRDGHYLALCGIHRPEDMLTEDPAAVTCGRCRRRVVFPGLLPASVNRARPTEERHGPARTDTDGIT